MTFQEWLETRDIDCQTLTIELQRSLRARWEAEFPPAAPPAEKLVQPSDCQWPQRNYRIAAEVAQ